MVILIKKPRLWKRRVAAYGLRLGLRVRVRVALGVRLEQLELRYQTAIVTYSKRQMYLTQRCCRVLRVSMLHVR